MNYGPIECRGLKTWLHKLDPRTKILGLFVFLLFILSTQVQDTVTLTFYGVFIFVLFWTAHIPAGFILKRFAALIPFLCMISVWVPFSRQITHAQSLSEEVIGLGVIMFKAILCILCTVLLISTTDFRDLMKGLQKIGVSSLITMILSFMYRYLFVIQDDFMKMNWARESRSSGKSPWSFPAFKRHQFGAIANMIGSLFLRSYEESDDVYSAMCARGFHGRISTLNNFNFGTKDIFFILIVMIAGVLGKMIG